MTEPQGILFTARPGGCGDATRTVWALARLLVVGVAASLIGSGFAQVADARDPSAPVVAAPPLRYVPRTYEDRPSVEQLESLGRRIFFDPGLSASGSMACATCHSPERAFSPANDLPVQLGGQDASRPGVRNPPSLKYLQYTIRFTEHYIDDENGRGEDVGPTGGLTWDGRVNTPHDQALIPLFARHEMDNGSARELAARLRISPYAGEFREAFSAPGEDVFDRPDQVLGWLTMALEVLQESQPDFYPFDSKYDAFLRHQTSLDAQELRGLGLFNDPQKGNCASCHPSAVKASGAFPLFTDAGYAALGVPRNAQIPANRDAASYDLGLCGPLRTDLMARPGYCGLFKVPTLRNVALRNSFFHNGSFHSLRDVVEFYVQRDIAPERWYPRDSDGRVRKFDDLPPVYHGNVNVDPPFAPLPGGEPRLTASEIDDVVAFLNTLTDGYRASTARVSPASDIRSSCSSNHTVW
jgi:cytochrome c peroxidase